MVHGRKTSVGLIGAGGIADSHARAFSELKDVVDFQAICEIDGKRGKEFQKKYGIPKLFNDHKKLLADKRIEVIAICTPAFNHAKITCTALRAGKWVICEKPIGGSIKETDAILAAERETGMRAASICQNRAGKGMRALSELIQSGKTGKPLVGISETFWNRSQKDYYEKAAWRGTWKGETGGCLITHAIHIIDGLLSVMGEPDWVSSDAATLNHLIEVDDCSASTLHFKNGAMANIIATSCNHEDSSRLRFVFENMAAVSHEGAYNFGSMPWRFFSTDADLQKEITTCLEKWQADADPEGHKGQLLNFIRAYQNKSEPQVSVKEARKCLELIAGIYRSAITGKKTTFPIARDDPFYSSMNGGKMLRGSVKKQDE